MFGGLEPDKTTPIYVLDENRLIEPVDDLEAWLVMRPPVLIPEPHLCPELPWQYYSDPEG